MNAWINVALLYTVQIQVLPFMTPCGCFKAINKKNIFFSHSPLSFCLYRTLMIAGCQLQDCSMLFSKMIERSVGKVTAPTTTCLLAYMAKPVASHTRKNILKASSQRMKHWVQWHQRHILLPKHPHSTLPCPPPKIALCEQNRYFLKS